MKMFRGMFVLLIFGGGFIFGLVVNYTPRLDVITEVKRSVLDILKHPDSADFRNVEYNNIRNTKDGGSFGYVCGETFRLNQDGLPEGFKRFIVKVYENTNGINSLSIPIVEGWSEMVMPDQITALWRMYCE